MVTATVSHEMRTPIANILTQLVCLDSMLTKNK